MLNNKDTNTLERPKPQLKTPIRIVSAVAAGSVLTVTFNQVVALIQLPKFATDVVGATPVSATQPTPTSVAVTFSASIAAATEMTVEFQDGGVRNTFGGYVADLTFPC